MPPKARARRTTLVAQVDRSHQTQLHARSKTGKPFLSHNVKFTSTVSQFHVIVLSLTNTSRSLRNKTLAGMILLGGPMLYMIGRN
jgi:hypothetical protein